MKFALFVEGHTEKSALPQFLRRWLDGSLQNRVGIRLVRFDAWRHYFQEIGKKVSLNLSGRTGDDTVACLGLLDLYGPDFYPDHVKTAPARYTWAKSQLEAQVANPKFRQHFAVHEIEAWLLADPTILPREVADGLPKRDPESVNFNEPPKQLLERLYRERLHRRYGPVIDGTNLFQKLDPVIAKGRCPYLAQMLDDMARLARAAGA